MNPSASVSQELAGKKWCAQAVVACADLEMEETLVSVLRRAGFYPIRSENLEEIKALLAEEETVMAFSQTSLFPEVLRASEAGPKVPVVACSGWYDEDFYLDAMCSGAFEYLSSPYSREEVEWVVHSAMAWGPLLGRKAVRQPDSVSPAVGND
jgi:DNA-binding NtrC family response regulator